jgi:hypothetical protein
VGRVVFTKNAEPVDWLLEIESRLQEISASSCPSHPAVGPPAAPMNNQPESASRGSVVSLSSHLDIIAEFHAAIAAAVSSKGSL